MAVKRKAPLEPLPVAGELTADGPETDPQAADAAALRDNPAFASTLANGLAVLGCFSSIEPTLGNREIADRLGLPKPTVSRLAFTLMALGYLRRERSGSKYQLGPAVLSLGYPLLTQLTVRQVAAFDMLKLARLAGGPVSVGVRDRLQVVYVETQGEESNPTRPGIGSTRPMLRTAVGRSLLFAHPAEERAALERQLQQEQPQLWAAHQAELSQAYTEIDERGFCVVAGAWRPALAAVGVPMKGEVHGLQLAFNLTVPSYAASRTRLVRQLGPRLVELVRGIEVRLGL